MPQSKYKQSLKAQSQQHVALMLMCFLCALQTLDIRRRIYDKGCEWALSITMLRLRLGSTHVWLLLCVRDYLGRRRIFLQPLKWISKACINSYLCCATEAMAAGQGSTLRPRTEPLATDIDFKRILWQSVVSAGNSGYHDLEGGKGHRGEQAQGNASRKRNGREKLKALNN